MNNEVKNIDLEERLFNSIVTTIKNAPFMENLKISLLYLAHGKAGIEMTAGPEFLNTRGIFHGGIIATLVDTAMGIAGLSLDLKVTTQELNLNYIGPAKAGDKLTADARVIHKGRKSVVVEARVYNGHSRLISISRGTFFIFKEKYFSKKNDIDF